MLIGMGSRFVAVPVVALALMSLAGATSSVGATERDASLVVASGPLATFHGYAPPVVVIQKGDDLTYANFDIVQHDVVHDAAADGISGPKKRPWCGNFKKGSCPVFWSERAGLGAQTPVLGLNKVKPGKSYTFYCTLHPSMVGTLVVAP
ncbi:MAG TPA: hypothetical protein VFS18_04785 [Actinomycetota bacterium]|nr:hypothetical protein [Actinomycetota bacterium]